MKGGEIGNMALHFGGGAALAVLVCWNHWFVVPATGVYAFLREQAQHRWIIERLAEDPVDHRPCYDVEKRSFFDFSWLGWHQVWEIAQWIIGAAVVCGIGEVTHG